MEQNDRTRVDPGNQFLESFFLRGLLLLDPVHIGKTPEKGGIAKFFCHGKIFCAVDTAGRPVKFGHGFARYGSIEFFHAFKFLLKGFHRRNLRHIRMGHRMVSHNMPLCDHAFDKIGIIFDKISDSKKDSGSLVLFKCLQDCRGVSILISGIKSQIEDFFVSIAGIIGVVLFQIIDRGVSSRTFSFFLKT